MKRSVFGAALGVIVFIGPAFANDFYTRKDSFGDVHVQDRNGNNLYTRKDSFGDWHAGD